MAGNIEGFRRRLMEKNSLRQWGDKIGQHYRAPNPPILAGDTHDQEKSSNMLIESSETAFPRPGNQSPPNFNPGSPLSSKSPIPSADAGRIFNMTTTKGWTIDGIIEDGNNFHLVERVSATAPDLLEKIKKFEASGIPLVIEGFHKHPKWPQHMFTIDQFVETYEETDIKVRNVHTRMDNTLPLRDFIARCRVAGPHRTETELQRYYGKDIECPKPWDDWLQEGGVVPKELISKGPEDVFRHLPNTAENAVETLMCYIGIGDTFTPCHKDLCASSGQNLMCYTERDGSSFWFMTASSSAEKAADFFQSIGHELDHENYFLKLEELHQAPFKVYVLEQKLGDMVLVPPRSCHQVINSGGMTFKTSWSRMTTKGLRSAFYQELPIYRRVCRPEIYQIKSTTYHSLLALTTELEKSLSHSIGANDHTLDELKETLLLYEAILTEEYDEEIATTKTPSNDNFRRTCDFCVAEIFQSYFECDQCCESTDEPLHLCLGCYSEGRKCQCQVGMKPMQSRDFQILRKAGSAALKAIDTYEQRFNKPISNLGIEIASIRDETPQLFHAGFILHKLYNKPIPKRRENGVTCDVRKNGERLTHQVDSFEILYCNKCRYSTCYQHILSEFKLHVSQALILSSSGSGDQYHAMLLKGNATYTKDVGILDKARRYGYRPCGSQLYTLLTYNALKYAICTPANQTFTVPGWYDTLRIEKPTLTLKIPRTILQSTSVMMSAPEEIQRDDSLSPLTPLPSSPLPYHEETPPRTITVVKLPIKRKFDVFVEIPNAPYDTSCLKGLSQTRQNHQAAPIPNPRPNPRTEAKTPGVFLNRPTIRYGPPRKLLNKSVPRELVSCPPGNTSTSGSSFPSGPPRKLPKFKKNLQPPVSKGPSNSTDQLGFIPPSLPTADYLTSPSTSLPVRSYAPNNGNNESTQLPSEIVENVPVESTAMRMGDTYGGDPNYSVAAATVENTNDSATSQAMLADFAQSTVAAAVILLSAVSPVLGHLRVDNHPTPPMHNDPQYFQHHPYNMPAYQQRYPAPHVQYSPPTRPQFADAVGEIYTPGHPFPRHMYSSTLDDTSGSPYQSANQANSSFQGPSFHAHAHQQHWGKQSEGHDRNTYGSPYGHSTSHSSPSFSGHSRVQSSQSQLERHSVNHNIGSSSFARHSPYDKSPQRGTSPRLERRRWDRDQEKTNGPSRPYPKNAFPRPSKFMNKTYRQKDGRKSSHKNRGSYSGQSANSASIPPYNATGEQRFPQAATHRSHSQLERRTYADRNPVAEYSSHGYKGMSNTPNLEVIPDIQVNDEKMALESRTEMPTAFDGTFSTSQDNEPEVNNPTTDIIQGHLIDDNWEDSYEQPDDVEPLPPPTFRIERRDSKQDSTTTSEEHFNYNPWN